jgi:tetratricopeptide (TPR) repeat protein
MDLVYMSRPDSALALIEARRAEDPEDPFVLLLKTKVLRERLNDEDNNKELVRRSAESIHALLDSAIALSSEALRRDASDARQYYYRGYCWLNKAQLHVLARSYWAAGRTAARGKDDLERYLKTHPDDPDAQGVLGAFLYFADAIPRYVRFVAKLLFIPTGDREKGLTMMRYAATHDGLFSTDWRFVLAAIDMVFDGNFERGTEEFIRLLDEFPHYTRLAEPLAVVAPLYPTRTAELRRIAERALDTHLTLDPEHVDWSLVKRMRLLNAFTDSYFGRPREALEEYAALAADPPRHPDWVPAIALLNRGYLLQKLGGRDEARRSFETVRANPRSAYYHRVCETMLATLDLPLKAWEADDLGFVAAIYEGAHTDAAARLRFYAEKYGEDAAYDFYAGDLAALSGDTAAARTAYEEALSRAEAGGDQIYQLFAAARLAELLGSEGRYDKAREYLKRARGYCYANYLLRFLLESRERFYDLRDKGRMEGEPALFTPRPPRR